MTAEGDIVTSATTAEHGSPDHWIRLWYRPSNGDRLRRGADIVVTYLHDAGGLTGNLGQGA